MQTGQLTAPGVDLQPNTTPQHKSTREDGEIHTDLVFLTLLLCKRAQSCIHKMYIEG